MRSIAIVLLLLLSGLLHATEPTRENLIAAWERMQLADPEVEVLEAVGERQYRFRTSHFDYEGPLEITDVVVDRMGGMDDTVMGMVQVALPDFSAEDMERRAFSYSRWTRNNTLYWSQDEGRWVDMDEWSTHWEYDYSRFGLPFLDWTPLIILSLFFAFLLWTSFESRKQMKETMAGHREAMKMQEKSFEVIDRSIRMQEEGNALLREIRDAIKKP